MYRDTANWRDKYVDIYIYIEKDWIDRKIGKIVGADINSIGSKKGTEKK